MRQEDVLFKADSSIMKKIKNAFIKFSKLLLFACMHVYSYY